MKHNMAKKLRKRGVLPDFELEAEDTAAADAGDGAENTQVNFGKRLAHTDKKVRDRGFQTLRKWLQKHPDLSRLEYLKLWKGLYFGMWMADKRPVQQELCVHTALLINDVPQGKRMMWIDTFWEIMTSSWEKLDKHRMNKYLLFLRIIVAEMFKVLRLGGWPIADVKATGETFVRSVPKHKGSLNVPSLGLLLQFTGVFWEELLPQKPSTETALELVKPFLAVAETVAVQSLSQCIHQHILRKTPEEMRKSLAMLVLNGAAREDISKMSRDALYETADFLEKPTFTAGSNMFAPGPSPTLRKVGSAAAAGKSASVAVPANSAQKKGKKRKAGKDDAHPAATAGGTSIGSPKKSSKAVPVVASKKRRKGTA